MKMPPVQDDVVLLAGGLDQVTPTLALGPGKCRRMMNFECAINGGYTRIGGHERFDGRTSPSSATFSVLPLVEPSTVSVAIGTVITGATSGTTGTAVTTFPVGSTYFAVTLVIGGGFVEGEALTTAGVICGVLGPQMVTLTKTLKKQYVNLAADQYRALIAAVPGVGPVRGVFGATFNAVWALYAMRDESISNAQSALYKATSTGWSQVWGFPASNGFREVNFRNGGPSAIAEGSVATAASLGSAGQTILRLVQTGGSWAANTATGKILSASPFFGSSIIYTFGDSTITTLSASEQGGGTLSPNFRVGGKFEMTVGNFYGQNATTRVYGVDGAGRAWEFDGTYVMFIDLNVPTIENNTKSNTVRPTHVAVHHNHLILSVGSSIFTSGIGTPFDYTASAGAGEYAAGDAITGFMVLPGVQASGSLAVLQRNHTKVLYGTALAGPEPFDLVSFETETGALDGTIQKLDRVYYLDDRGVIDLKVAQEYGNFTTATLTRFIQTYIDQKHGRASCSMVHRGKGQYRLFFNDGTGLYLTLDNGKLRGVAPVAFPVPFFCAWSGEDNAGQEVAFVGGTDGFVYQLDRGTSFDGANIDAELLLNWNTMKSPRVRKALKKASLEFRDTDYTELRVGSRLGPELTAHLQEEAAGALPTTHELDMQWDHFTWDDFYWDSHSEAPLEIDVKGTAERVQYAISSSSDYLDPFTLTSIITPYILRRRLR